jgi:hypothetical protein
MVPRALVPVVQSLIRDQRRQDQQGEGEERSLYAGGDEENTQERRKDDD